jgi:hypothetical protein
MKATANQFRLFLHAGAYWLMWGLRASMPRHSMWRVAATWAFINGWSPANSVSDMFLEEKHGALFAGQPQRRPRLGNAVFENRSG